MYDDSSSTASFEDLASDHQSGVSDNEARPVWNTTVERLKAIVAKSAAEGSNDSADGKVPDVVYAVQYKPRYRGRAMERESSPYYSSGSSHAITVHRYIMSLANMNFSLSER